MVSTKYSQQRLGRWCVCVCVCVSGGRGVLLSITSKIWHQSLSLYSSQVGKQGESHHRAHSTPRHLRGRGKGWGVGYAWACAHTHTYTASAHEPLPPKKTPLDQTFLCTSPTAERVGHSFPPFCMLSSGTDRRQEGGGGDGGGRRGGGGGGLCARAVGT